MAKLFGLTAEQQQRLARVADKVEGQPIQRANQQSGTSRPSPSFWAELTEEDPDNPGRYAWKLVDYVDHEWTDRSPAIESPEGEYSAIEANLGSGMTGKRVEVQFRGYDAGGKPQYLFGQTALPFMAMIWDRGPNDEPDYSIGDWRYWAIPVGIHQNSPPAPPTTTDNNWIRTHPTGEPFTLVNTAERLIVDVPPNGYIQANVFPRKMLWRGHICRVWTELDDQGVPRRVCSEYPGLAAWVQITGPATGDFAGKEGYYDGSQRIPISHPYNHIEVPGGNRVTTNHVGAASPAVGGVSTTNVLIINLSEINANRGLAVADKGYQSRNLFLLGHRWGWTNEEVPRQAIVVDDAACDPVTMTATQNANASYGSNEQDMLNALKADVAEIIQSLKAAQMMRIA